MQQEINLYKLLPRKTQSAFTWGMLYAVYGIFIIVLVLKWFDALWQKHKLIKEYQQEVVLLTEAQQKFQKLIKHYPTIDTKNIQTLGDSLRAELANELKIVTLLSQSSKFVHYMQALAEASTQNVWLTDILFSAALPNVVLKGYALQPQSAQQLLDQLGRQPVFTQLPLKISDLNQAVVDQNTIFTFNITTKLKSPI